jgi:hypothetical protein
VGEGGDLDMRRIVHGSTLTAEYDRQVAERLARRGHFR